MGYARNLGRYFWAPWIISILGLSSFSGYSVRNVGSMNFEIATMLTPLGMLYTYLSGPDYYLRPYYLVPTRMRPELWGSAGLMIAWIGFTVSSIALLRALRRRGRP